MLASVVVESGTMGGLSTIRTRVSLKRAFMKKTVIVTCLVFGLVSAVQADGDGAAGKAESWLCVGCHGADGNSMAPNFPKLAGQTQAELTKQLKDFKAGLRKNDMMSAVAANVGDADIPNLTAYYSSQVRTADKVNDEGLAARGQKLFHDGDAANGVPACATCHGATGAGNPALHAPALSGQHATYIATQLRAFKSGQRSNDPAGMMRNSVARLPDDEMGALSEYIGGMPVQRP